MSILQKKGIPLALSVLVHVAFAALFVASLDIAKLTPDQPKPEIDVIQAVAVDEDKIQAELDKLKKAEQRKRADEDKRQRELESEADRARKKRETEEQKLADLKQKKEQERQRLTELEKKKKTETERAAKEQAAEQERLKKLQAEREALEKKKQEEQKRVAELELKRKLEEEQVREKAQQDKERKEKERQQAEQDKQIKVAVMSHVTQIRAKVESVWNRPPNFAPGVSCTVRVTLIPTGEVIDARLSSCTGDAIFERSVEAAVQKASPLPVPKDPAVFDRMREIDFVFKPQ